MSNTVFSITLQALRKKKGVTQEQVANFLGVSPQAVSKWENGSYPEGDLLPKLSEYFEVSISYLYGQETETVSLEQQVFDTLQDIMKKHQEAGAVGTFHPEYFDKMLDISWAFQNAAWKNNKEYFKRVMPEKGLRTASVITDDAGFGYFNLNEEKQFYTIVREPEDGFVKHMGDTEEFRKFFEVLGEPGALEILFYLLSLNHHEYVTVDTIVKSTKLAKEQVEKLLEKAGKFMEKQPNPSFQCIKILDEDTMNVAYSVDVSSVSMFVSLLLTADSIIHAPFGYQMQIGMRGKSWFDRNDVVEKLKKK